MKSISEILRAALARSLEGGAVLREIARAAEIDASQLYRFSNDIQPGGKLSQDGIDRLGAHLGLELRPKTRSRRKG
jgi:transposase-like protein